ncbi:hypothetical protein KM295_14210 [Natronomonas sp. F2-12]|uniref:Uncharacterized protein n=1 Tax=Natronomonas aquatica TaxID=2841590 RepID=A0A9R1CSY0_9EURY|nr:hypothetical protein [Natronomonas aquatica]MCQ4334609.1 hypothetical protein [Natronomonas aquatica]
MSDDDPPGGNKADQRVQERLGRLQKIRDQWWGEGTGGQFDPQTKRYIATVIMQVWDSLYQYRNKPILSEDDFPDVSPIRERLGREKDVITDSKRLGEKRTVKSVPAVDDLSGWYLIELSEELDDLADKLDFGADVPENPETSEFDESDLVTLASARNQEDAIEDAPDDITGRVIDTLEEYKNGS